jgi:hypothetical protein
LVTGHRKIAGRLLSECEAARAWPRRTIMNGSPIVQLGCDGSRDASSSWIIVISYLAKRTAMQKIPFVRLRIAFARILPIAGLTIAMLAQPSLAESPQLTMEDEVTIRGTIAVIDPLTRTIVIESPERDTLAYRALDRVNLRALKSGMLVDVRYYRIVDYLVAKTTPEASKRAWKIMDDLAQAPGVAGTEMRIRLWLVTGMVVRTLPEANKIQVVQPDGGSIYLTPWIKSATGQATLRTLQGGDMITLVFSERSAFEVTPVR